MKKGCLLILLVVLVVGALAYGWVKGTYNGFVEQQESVKTAWAAVQSDYQRRADLIPNLVNTVKGYAKHEQETLEAVMEARSKATSVTIDADNLDEASLQKFQAAQGEISNALSRLIAVSEAYPDLKANEQFMALQQQLEGTENRINVSRKDFNEAVKSYNVAIRQFPANVLAGIIGFETKAAFEAQAGAEKAPTVEF